MTHAEILSNEARHWPNRLCPGELVETGRYPESRLSSGGPLDITVVIYCCPLCHHVLSIEEDSGRVRNCYPFRARDFIRDLAAAKDATPLFPRTSED